jgi:hypothetical protein
MLKKKTLLLTNFNALNLPKVHIVEQFITRTVCHLHKIITESKRVIIIELSSMFDQRHILYIYYIYIVFLIAKTMMNVIKSLRQFNNIKLVSKRQR